VKLRGLIAVRDTWMSHCTGPSSLDERDFQGLNFKEPTIHFNEPTNHFKEPTNHFKEPTNHFKEPTNHFKEPTNHFKEPTIHFNEPTNHFKEPTNHFKEPTNHFKEPTNHFKEPTNNLQEPTNRHWTRETDVILQKRPVILRSVLILATPRERLRRTRSHARTKTSSRLWSRPFLRAQKKKRKRKE